MARTLQPAHQACWNSHQAQKPSKSTPNAPHPQPVEIQYRVYRTCQLAEKVLLLHAEACLLLGGPVGPEELAQQGILPARQVLVEELAVDDLAVLVALVAPGLQVLLEPAQRSVPEQLCLASGESNILA